MLTLSTPIVKIFRMARSTHPRQGKKPAKPYHHGDLRQALLDEALRTIQTHGVEHLTLRTVGERLGVSRSALYRHFADKQSLLATVGKEGSARFGKPSPMPGNRMAAATPAFKPWARHMCSSRSNIHPTTG